MNEITVLLRKKDVGDAKNASDLLNNLSEKHEGKWVAILKNGQILANQKLDRLYSEAGGKEITVLFRAPRRGELRA